jgi:hypothetical protein
MAKRAPRVPPSASPLPTLQDPDATQGIPDEDPPEQPGDDPGGLAALEQADITEQPDGSAVVDINKGKKAGPEVKFHANLAETLPDIELAAIATELTEQIRRDKEARKKRDEQYAEGLRRSGLGEDAPGGAQFTGASRVVHPMLAEASVDFESSAIKELFPPEGPVRPQVFGKPDPEKLELAQRQQDCLNWQLRSYVPEFRAELERVLTQVPMGGSQYMKFWYDADIGWWTAEAAWIDDVYIPFTATTFQRATRITHVQHLSESAVEDRIASGFYRDIGGLGHSGMQEETETEKATDKIEGRERIEPDVDNERPVFETSCFQRLSLDGDKKRPYLVSLDDFSGRIFSIYRNWEEDDVRYKRLAWMVEWPFIPWRGAYAIGFPHLIGGLSAAATGALRALLDSAHVNNIPGGLVLKGTGISGQTTTTSATQFAEVATSMPSQDDIRKIAMPFPYNPPSNVLFTLLGWLTDAGKGVVTTAEEKIADASNNMPVGTALALMESGSKVFSAIHKRMHEAQFQCFQIIARLCAKIPDFEQIQEIELGEVIATKQDFAKALAVQPASDPDVYSEGQRFSQAQVMDQQAAKYPQLYDMYQVQKRILTVARIPDIDDVLPPPAKPQPLNAAAENAAAMAGKPLVAFPDQAHLAHIMVHLLFQHDPLLGGSPSAGTQYMLNIAEHLKQHVMFQYVVLVRQLASESLGTPVDVLMKQAIDDPQKSAELDQLIAAAAPMAQQMLTQQLAPVAQELAGIFSKADQAKQGMAIPHPDQVAAATMVDDATRKAQTDAGNLDIRNRELASKTDIANREVALKERQGDAKIEIDQEKANNERTRNQLLILEAQQPGNQVPGIQ